MPDDATLTGPQRRAALERLHENLVLRSGAGCGKTFVLARRFVRLLETADPASHPLRRLVALTFTDKAALEMAQRVRKMLRELASTAAGARRKALLGWLEELPEARISTIHSFCGALLRGHAVEAGLDPAFAVCADTDLTERLLTEAADETLLAAVEAEEPPALALAARFTFDRLVALLGRLARLSGPDGAAGYADPAATVTQWDRQIKAASEKAWQMLAANPAIPAALAEVEAAACTDPSDKFCLARDAAVAAIRGLLSDPATRTPETLKGIQKAGNVGRQACWDVPLTEVRPVLASLIDTIWDMDLYVQSPGESDRAAAEALAALTGLAARTAQRYARAKRARGILDFDDLIVHTHRLIRECPEVRGALAGSIDQLLVDECQDTDAVQLSLLLPLLGGDETTLPPEGKLFVVGDAKQSIYRFRGAQVEVFDDLCRRLGPARQETLDTSFRTHRAGVEFVNRLFAPLMKETFEPIRAHRPERPPGPSVEILLAQAPDGNPIEDAAGATAAQAQVLADRIAAMLDGGEKIVWDAAAKTWRAARPGDIAVLFSRMTHSLAYERALQGRGVPYYLVGGVGFFQQQEVYDLINALKVVDNPMADVPFLGVLRSSLVGLDDNALTQIARHVSRPYLPALLQAGPAAVPLPDYQQDALAGACRLLQSLHARKDAVGIDALLEDLLAATGYEAAMMSAAQGRRIVGNIRQFVDRARGAAAQGTALADFLAEIEDLILSESRQEQAAVAGEEDDVVRIMTIHRAKGLEFPVVILPDLNAGLRPSSEALLSRHGWPLVLRPPSTEEDEEAPLAYRVCAAAEAADARLEDLRKFYVAATRHEDYLVLLGADQRTREGGFEGAGSFLSKLDEALGISTALEEGQDRLAYGDGFEAVVRCVRAGKPAAAAGGRKRGSQLLATARDGQELAKGMLAAGGKGKPLPLVGRVDAEGELETAVTALGDFAACPRLYWWRHELRAPVEGLIGRGTDAAKPQAEGREGEEGLDAATLGTLYHLCMERLDFAKPQAANALVRLAAEEMELGAIGPEAARDLAQMIERFRGTELWREMAGAKRTHRELAFVLKLGTARLRGQIDAIYQDAAGAWHIVDYKSDRVREDELAGHAKRYELQMRAYGLAAGRFLGAPPADAVLYFLRAGRTHRFALSAEPGPVEALAAELAKARRTGQFDRGGQAPCGSCPYGRVCRLSAGGPEGERPIDKGTPPRGGRGSRG